MTEKNLVPPSHEPVVFKCWVRGKPKRYCYVRSQTAYFAWNRAAVELKVDPQQVGVALYEGDEKKLRKSVLES